MQENWEDEEEEKKLEEIISVEAEQKPKKKSLKEKIAEKEVGFCLTRFDRFTLFGILENETRRVRKAS